MKNEGGTMEANDKMGLSDDGRTTKDGGETLRLRFVVRNEALQDLTVDEMTTLEDLVYGESTRLRAERALFARFLVDHGGAILSTAQAQKQIGALQVREMGELRKRFGEALRDALVPPASGSG